MSFFTLIKKTNFLKYYDLLHVTPQEKINHLKGNSESTPNLLRNNNNLSLDRIPY